MVTAAKTTSQIGMHMGVAFGLMYVFTGSLALGGVAAVVEPIVNVTLLPLHDKMWERIRAKIEARKANAASVATSAIASSVAPKQMQMV
ncbi:DUF2061 domain-containing protein [Herminiimonas fonticola]|uniref:Putative membrane protein n=1 Tax=Herminiimonas fonticola TaxID=303380 RepID=A0A4R6GFQ5_9BURK|nr:DUF2061 domain-containing protein [Herminiimonas fonticola]RBA24579.1 putative membrane protein [Herminiimonas fonticola]TDN93696.1 putative membrane protein [Herminiimonas fonticola]